MRAVKALLAKLAASRAVTLLLRGESGTGKGLLAREIHAVSPRRARAFQHILCSALPETLLESELFGHEAGAFTDARRRKQGLVESADGGTVFLDEIGDMGHGLQVKLLRFLEERTFKRLGGTADIHVDVRVIAATNRDLERGLREGTFRPDLYYRLNVLPVWLPPLRERLDDVPLLAEHFIADLGRALGKRVRGLSPEAQAMLRAYAWPGNVRELKNMVERAMLLAEGEVLARRDFLSFSAPRARPARFALPPEGIVLAELERDLLRQALERAQGNQTQAARLLGLTRHQIHYRLRRRAPRDTRLRPLRADVVG